MNTWCTRQCTCRCMFVSVCGHTCVCACRYACVCTVRVCLWICGRACHQGPVFCAVTAATAPLRASAWGGSRCSSNIPRSLQKIKQTNEKLTRLLARDAPELTKLPLASPAEADGGCSRAHLGPWHWCRQAHQKAGGCQAAVGCILL